MAMYTTQELKDRVCQAIDARQEEIAAFTEQVLSNAELGYCENETSALVQEQYDRLGIAYESGLALTGIKASLVGDAGLGPKVAVIGELDGLPIADHPEANPKTGAAHACGHNAQTAMVVAVATGLIEAGLLPELNGEVICFHVPAEELVDLEYRQGLKREGKIRYLVGKPELIRLGAFDGVDMCMMVHNTGTPADLVLGVGTTLNGCVMKTIVYRGRGAHAGASPWLGVNALNAANLAFNAIHARRETFKDEDAVRIHWIITKGGAAVNVVPDEVRIEMFVRARTTDALAASDAAVDLCLKAGAMATGAEVEIETLPGYMPILPYPELDAVFRENAELLVGRENVSTVPHKGGSTDLGDLSLIMPAIHPFAGGATGNAHGTTWHAGACEASVLRPAKAMAMTVIDLLSGGASRAQDILARSRPPMTKDTYLEFLNDMERVETYKYGGDGA
jgi:amidohydrolase